MSGFVVLLNYGNEKIPKKVDRFGRNTINSMGTKLDVRRRRVTIDYHYLIRAC